MLTIRFLYTLTRVQKSGPGQKEEIGRNPNFLISILQIDYDLRSGKVLH